MLVWCMLVVGLNDEMKNQHVQDDSQICLTFDFTSNTRTLLIMLISRGIQCFCVISKWYLANHGAKDGTIGALRLVSCFKGPSLIPYHHLVDITLPQLQLMHMCKLQSKLLAHMQGEQMLPMGVDETCPNALHMVKNAWASNMDSK